MAVQVCVTLTEKSPRRRFRGILAGAARYLTRRHIQHSPSTQDRLREILAKNRLHAMASQWAFTISTSIIALTPQLIIFYLLERLATPRRGIDIQGLYLALALGLSKLFDLWIRAAYILHLRDGMVEKDRWMTLSNIVAPIKADERPAELQKTKTDHAIGDSHVQMNKASTETNDRDTAIQLPTTNITRDEPTRTSWASCRAYFRATTQSGTPTWLLAVAATVTYELLSFTKTWWLKEWASRSGQASNKAESKMGSYIATYMVIPCLSCVATATRCFVWYVIGRRSSTTLFERMAIPGFGSPLQSLEDTPDGEIVTRFTSDISTIDHRFMHDFGYVIERACKIMTIILTR